MKKQDAPAGGKRSKNASGGYVCTECGSVFPQWAGQCSDCGTWNTLSWYNSLPAESSDPRALYAAYNANSGYAGGGGRSPAQPVPLNEVVLEETLRYSSGMEEFDRVLGGGIVPGSVLLLGGDPGIGKSTLLLQMALSLSPKTGGLYISGEESLSQIAGRAARLGKSADQAKLWLLAETRLENILEHLDQQKPSFAIIDSIQTIYGSDLGGAPGNITQLRECTARLARYAKNSHTTLFIVGHVTKSGEVAGPRVLEHIVDTVIFFEGQSDQRWRLLRVLKNRFGAVNELGVFAMTEQGLREQKNPSGIFLARGNKALPGSVVMALWEGTRPLLLEIQALVDESAAPLPRRVVVGLEANRMALLLAVLHRHGGVFTASYDIFVNVVGGMRVQETSADLAVLSAIYSSFKNRPLAQDLLIFGEVGLGGELRPVSSGQDRLKEAAKQGFKKAIIPKANGPLKSGLKAAPGGLEVWAVDSLKEALECLDQLFV